MIIMAGQDLNSVDCQSLIKELLDKNTKMKDELSIIYKKLMAFLESRDIQGTAMEYVYLYERDNLVARFSDLQKNEKCPIVVAGETSAGKSSFLNLLLGPDFELLPHSATSTICCLHNSQEKKFICYNNNEKVSKRQMLHAAATCKNLQEKLAPFISTRKGSMGQLSHVDIFWPIPMIQDQVILVDTPGIGESREMTDKLLHFLPNAVAFIYVISSDNAGSIQHDRLLRIWSEVERLKSGGKFFWDQTSAIFVCNKWDLVQKSGEEDKVWKDTLAKIRKGWPGVDDSQILKMSTTNALKLRKQLEITEDFQELLQGLKKLVPLTLEARIKHHYKFLEPFISKLESCLASHISNARRTQEERKLLNDAVFSRLKNLKENSDKAQKKLHSEAEKACKELADNLFKHVQTEGVKNQLFTWDDADAPKLGAFTGTMEQVREKAEYKIRNRFQTILNEWEERNGNMKAISDKLTKLFYHECQILDKECQQINLMIEKPGGSLTCFDGSDYENKFEDHSFSGLNIGTSIIVTVALVPFFSLPVLAAYIAILKFNQKNEKKKNYNANKPMKMQEWAIEFWKTNLTKDNINKIIKCEYLQEYTKKIRTVFENQIKDQIAADENTMNAIANEMRSPTEIYEKYCPMQKQIQSIKGSLLLFDLKYFASDLVPSQNVTQIDPISSGSFADVWKVKWIKSENEVVMAALKCPRNRPGDYGIFEQVTEVQCLRASQHQHIVTLIGVLYDVTNGKVQPLLELCEETLEDYIFNHENRICGKHNNISKMQEAFKVYVTMTTGVSDGLAYIHRQGYLHRDLKMTNILVKNGIPKICDVGIAKRAELVTGTFTGNITHVAPEVIEGKLYTFSADVYSLGIILWETWYGQQAFTSGQFKSMSLPDLINYITGGQRLTFENVRPWHDLESLISKCWHQDEKVRPQAAAIKSEILQIERNNTK